MTAKHPALVATLLSAACFVGGGDRTWEFDGASVEVVSVDLGNGEVHIESGIEPDVRVEFSGGGVSFEGVPRAELIDGVVYVDGCEGACGGDIVVYVPDGVAIDAQVERGELSIDLVAQADIAACVAAGDVDIIVPAGDYFLALDAGAGSIQVAGVNHREDAPHMIQACVAAGDLSVFGRP